MLSLLKQPIYIEVNEASEKAIQAIQAHGGQVRIVHRSKRETEIFVRPDKNPVAIFKQIADYETTLRMEQYKKWGCEVDYHPPQWIKDNPNHQEELQMIQNKKAIF